MSVPAPRTRAKSAPSKSPAQAAPRGPAASAPAGGSSLGRAFQILNLFTLATPVLQVDHVVKALGYTRSTAYRYVKELCHAGLLTPTVNAGEYALGARIVELERLLELTDPLYRAGKAVLSSMGTDEGSLLLQSLNHRNQVLCIYKHGPDILEHGGLQVALTRSRGVPFQLFRGAASLVILAALSQHRIRQTYLSDPDRIAQAGLGQTWEEFRTRLAAIRRRGYAVSRTEGRKPLVVGIAVPVHLAAPNENRVIGSIVQVCAGDRTTAQELAAFERLRPAADRIGRLYVELAGSGAAGATSSSDPAGSAFAGWQLIS